MFPIDFFYRSARLSPDRIALLSGATAISYAELRLRVDAAASALQALDPLSKPHVVAINGAEAEFWKRSQVSSIIVT